MSNVVGACGCAYTCPCYGECSVNVAYRLSSCTLPLSQLWTCSAECCSCPLKSSQSQEGIQSFLYLDQEREPEKARHFKSISDTKSILHILKNNYTTINKHYTTVITSSYWEKPWWTTHVKEKTLMFRDLPVCAGASWAGSCWSAAGGRCCLLHKCSLGHCHRACLPAGSLYMKRQTD